MAEEYRKIETIIRETRVKDVSAFRIELARDQARVVVEHTEGSYDRFVPLSSLGKDEATFRACLDVLRKMAISDFEVVNVDALTSPASATPTKAKGQAGG